MEHAQLEAGLESLFGGGDDGDADGFESAFGLSDAVLGEAFSLFAPDVSLDSFFMPLDA
jgi:hypothetical protein